MTNGLIDYLYVTDNQSITDFDYQIDWLVFDRLTDVWPIWITFETNHILNNIFNSSYLKNLVLHISNPSDTPTVT